MVEESPPPRIAFDQRIAKFVVKGLARTPVSPNAVTAFSIVVGLCAAWLFSQGGVWAYYGAGVFVIAVWMDHVDGELARTIGKTSEFGHYFDHAAAMTNYVAMFLGAGIGLQGGDLGEWPIYLGIAAGVGVASIMTLRMYAETKVGRASMKQTVRAGFEIEDTLYVTAPLTWIGILEEFILMAGIGAPVFLMFVIWDFVRKSRSAGMGDQ